jgi:hypothetical protein
MHESVPGSLILAVAEGRRAQALRAALLLAAVLFFSGPAQSQSIPRAVVQERAGRADELFNWYYAAAYGTGVYKVGDETVGVVRAPLGYRIREPGEGQWGIRLTVPVTAALAEFDLTDFQLGRPTVAGLSVLPGVEVEIPLTGRWMLKPFANAGGGWEFQRDGSAFIYSAGASALYRKPLDDGRLAALGAKLTFAGYDSGGEASRLAALSLGGDIGVPVDLEIAGRPALIGVQLIGTAYFNRLEFLLPGSAEKQVLGEAEIALTVGVRKPIVILGAPFDRIGLGYRKGSDGLQGVRLVGSFPF